MDYRDYCEGCALVWDEAVHSQGHEGASISQLLFILNESSYDVPDHTHTGDVADCECDLHG